MELTRGRALVWLVVITAIGGAFRFYNLAWGAPFYHFHIDEHFVFSAADMLRRSAREAALSTKFFMYGPLPARVLNVVRGVYEAFQPPLVLSDPRDEVTYMVMGRAISAAAGTLQIPLAYVIAAKVSGRRAGLLAAAFLAVAVVHLRESHFFSVDITMALFVMLTWWAVLHMAEHGRMGALIGAGLGLGGIFVSKYSGGFMGIPMGAAHLVSPTRPRALRPASAWIGWVLRGMVPLAVAAAAFATIDWMAFRYWDKFKSDIYIWVVQPLTGQNHPLWTAQFADITNFRGYWFTNLLWWGLGPPLEIWGIAGVVWLVTRRARAAVLSALVALAYYAAAGGTTFPVIRYTIPLVPALAVAGGVLSADLMRRPRIRWTAAVATIVVLGSSALYAMAYMNVYRQLDSRVAAARYIKHVIPDGAPVLVERSQILPPMGDYYDRTNFNTNYQPAPEPVQPGWNPRVHLVVLDSYERLYSGPLTDDQKRAEIAAAVAQADWIILDESFTEFYAHLPWSRYAPMKQYYKDLTEGRLGFALDRTFKVYPSLLGQPIDDDASELTFRLFDHPRISIYRRTAR